MKKILLFGAGKSTTVMIDYFLKHADEEQWTLTVVDANLQLAQSKIAGHPHAQACSFDINDHHARLKMIGEADIVISMLPPALHLFVAKDCIACKKNLLTASYIDEPMLALKNEIENNDLFFLCEAGLDPGIDHMSAMQLFDGIRSEGGKITSFKSHCGGLVAPESDDNPWHYKISWNPANVVNAGKAGAVYLEKGKKIELDYRKIFEDAETIHVPELGNFAWYPNRNSMDYIPLYGLENCETFLRTTLRHPDYCIGWQAVIVAGLTNADNESNIKEFRAKSFNDWFLFSLHLYTDAKNFNDFLVKYIPKNQHEIVIKLFNYLGITSDDAIPEGFHTSADILRYLLDTRLQLHENDKDMIVMFHEITYEINDEIKELKSTLVVKGDDQLHTAMAKTVGLPLAAAAKLILNKTITAKGLHIPTAKEIYEPILKELSKNGISFKEYS